MATAGVYDRFRRRIMFPIANESGKIVAFGGRALGDDMPKYLNSPETPIYSKSALLYHLDRAKEPIRRSDFVVLVEGYMDTIAVARAGIANVVASCGTSLTEAQVKLLSRFTHRIVVNYDPDTAGQAATERSLALLLEQNFEMRVLALPAIDGKPADPDSYVQKKGAEAYREVAGEGSGVSGLLDRARAADGPCDRRRKVARREFSDAARAAHRESAAALGMGDANRAAAARGGAGAARSAAQGRSGAAQRSEDEARD